MKTFSKAVTVEQTTHFSITKAIRMGSTSICYCDNDIRADMVEKALNHWRKSEEGIAYYNKLLNSSDETKYKSCN